jgi:hypothetical protein
MQVIGWYPQIPKPYERTDTVRMFTEEILVQLDDPRTPITVIEAYPKFPARFARHTTLPEFWCIDSTVAQDFDAPNIRKLTVKWADTIPNALVRNGQPVYDDDPIKRPVRVSCEYYTMPKTYRLTYGKNQAYDIKKGPPAPTVPVTTTAGESLFLQVENEYPVFQCTKNVTSIPLFMAKNRMFTNSDTVTFQGAVFAPLMLLLCGMRLSEARFSNGRSYYQMDYRLMVAADDDGWCEKRRNAGFHEKVIDQPAVSETIFNAAKPEVSHLEAILIGKPESQHYPSAPVLLTPSGRAFRAPGDGQDSSTPQDKRTGPVLSVEGTQATKYGITAKDFDDAELKFYPRMAIPFNKFVPLI